MVVTNEVLTAHSSALRVAVSRYSTRETILWFMFGKSERLVCIDLTDVIAPSSLHPEALSQNVRKRADVSFVGLGPHSDHRWHRLRSLEELLESRFEDLREEYSPDTREDVDWDPEATLQALGLISV